jgi:hypothetical protein
MAITTEDQVLAGFQPPKAFMKTSLAAKAAGTPVAMGLLSAGFFPAATLGTPGLAGATIDGTTQALGGFFPFTNPSSGNTYLAKAGLFFGSGVVGIDIYDALWYNSGISVTTTTAQTINSVTLPARDATGTTSGVGVMCWVYIASATTSANTTATITYTNSSGTASRTGTIGLGGIPASATAGTFLPFTLQVGDVGIQSIQSLTLGTTLSAGTINLFLIREISYIGATQVSSGLTADWAQLGFPQLYNGTALSFWVMPSITTTGNCSGHICYAQG